MAGSGSLCQSGMTENITGISKGGEKPPYSLMSFWCRISKCHPRGGGAKLLIEFDGASAALWNDISHHSLFPHALMFMLHLLFPPLMDNKSTRETNFIHQLLVSSSCFQIRRGKSHFQKTRGASDVVHYSQNHAVIKMSDNSLASPNVTINIDGLAYVC